MALTLDGQKSLSQHGPFRDLVKQAMISTALAVYAEAPATTGHAVRAAFATGVLRDPDNYVVAFAGAVAANGAATFNAPPATPPTDQNIKDGCSAVWNHLAGV